MPHPMPAAPRRLSSRLLTTAGLALLCGWAGAQQVYRIVGPDGRVTFSDRPPPAAGAAAAGVAGAAATPAAPAAPAGPALPYALQQVASRFPVTLYSAPDCTPCSQARNLLVARGVPFSERTVITNEDIEALQRMSGEANLPFGTIGGQQLKGFSDLEWTQFLDAAGYPQTSQLPANFRRAAATPLVAVRPAAQASAPAPAAADAPRAVAAPAPAPAPVNPAGITF